MFGQCWTNAEDEYIKEWYPHTPVRKLAVLMGRNYTSVAKRAADLGIHKRRTPPARKVVSQQLGKYDFTLQEMMCYP